MDFPRKSEAEQKAFFDDVYERALQAEAACGKIERTLQVAQHRVRLVFAGESMVGELLPALAHLVVADPDGQAADGTLHIWDSISTGVAMPPPPVGSAHLTDRGDIWGFGGGRIRAAFHWIECSINVLDRETATGVFVVERSDALPFWTKASPLRTLLHWLMELHGCQLLHAAGFGTVDGGVLLTGPGGGGKSTAALSALRDGLRYVGDDYLIVGFDPEPTAYSLYNTAKLNADQVAAFPEFAPLISHRASFGVEKAVMHLFPEWNDRIAPSMPLRVMLTPHISGVPATTVQPVSIDILRRAAAFTTMSQLPYAGQYTYDFIGRLTERLPGLQLNLGTDLSGIAQAVTGVISDATTGAIAPRDTQVGGPGPPPLVSVIVPVYNGAEFLPEAIANILSQNYPSLEIIVVDDGSTDDIQTVVESLPVPVRLFRQENAGPSAARNRGIKDAAGEFLAFLDVDDLWPERNLATLVDALRANPEAAVIHGHAQLMERDADTPKWVFVGNPVDAFAFYIGAGIYRRTAFERVGLFDAELRFAEDIDWYQRAQEKNVGVIRLPNVNLFVRRHGKNMTWGKTQKELNVLRVFKMALDRKRRGTPTPPEE